MACICGGCEDCLEAQKRFETQLREIAEESEQEDIINWFPEDY